VKIDWPDDRCILCLGTPHDGDPMTQRTDAHVIPESVGGRLSAPLLCKRCNSGMGTLEAGLAKDPVVIDLVGDLVGRLAEALPAGLVQSIRGRASYVVDTEEFGRVYAGLDQQGALKPRQSDAILNDRNTLRRIKKELRRRGVDDETVSEKLRAFHEAQAGATIEVAPGFKVVKGISLENADWRRTYDEPLVSRAVPLAIAYLYLALCLGASIYDERLEPTRRALRDAIAGDDALDGIPPFDPMRSTAPPEPKHGLGIVEAEDGSVLVHVGLFREYVWLVPFPGVALPAAAPFYLLDLTTGEESCS